MNLYDTSGTTQLWAEITTHNNRYPDNFEFPIYWKCDREGHGSWNTPEVSEHIGEKFQPRPAFYAAVLEVCCDRDFDTKIELLNGEMEVLGALSWIQDNREFGLPQQIVIEKAKLEAEDFVEKAGENAERD